MRVDEGVPRFAQALMIRAWPIDDFCLFHSAIVDIPPALFEQVYSLDVCSRRAVAKDREHGARLQVGADCFPLSSDEWVVLVVLLLDREQEFRRSKRLTARPARHTDDAADLVLEAVPDCDVPVQ